MINLTANYQPMNQAQFICPLTKMALIQLTQSELNNINQQIGDKLLYRMNGEIVKFPFEQAYRRSDQKVLYGSTTNIADLRYYRAIDLTGGELIKKYSPTHGDNEIKFIHEMDYWMDLRHECPGWHNDHFRQTFDEHFGLTNDQTSGKRILDIGCGPLGSLEWATKAAYRVGLDPLSTSYRQLGTCNHQMDYVAGDCEALPYPDKYFDFVSSFNSLDHVDNLDLVISEINRVITDGGLLYILSDIHDEPTICEPQVLQWNLAEKFPDFEVIHEAHYEKYLSGLYDSLFEPKFFDHNNPKKRYGFISLKLRKKAKVTQPKSENNLTDIYQLIRLEHFPLKEATLVPLLLKTPRMIREVIFNMIDTRITQNSLDKKQFASALSNIIKETIYKYYPEAYPNGKATDKAYTEFYLSYAHICRELSECVIRIAVVDAQDRTGDFTSTEVINSAKKILLGW